MSLYTSALILAAGESKRMRRQKLLLPLGRATVLERTIDNFIASMVDEVIVVLGSDSEAVRHCIGNRAVKVVENPLYQQGMSTSIVAGMGQVGSGAGAVVLALADQPFVDTETINLLLQEFWSHGKGIAVPYYQEKRGNPVIIDIKYKDELLGLEGDVGGREVVTRHKDDVLEVAVDCEGVCLDIDTAEDYRRIVQEKVD